MHDKCLLKLSANMDDTTRRVLYAVANMEAPILADLQKRTGLSRHQVRSAILWLRGVGLVWGRRGYAVSEDGKRLVELLATPDREAAERVCDECLLQIGDILPREAYRVLGVLSRTARGLGVDDLIRETRLSRSQVQDALAMLRASRLVQDVRGRAFRLSADGRRLELLLSARQRQGVAPVPALVM